MKRAEVSGKREVFRLELVFAILAALLLVITLLSQKYLSLSPDIASFFIFLFIAVKLYEMAMKHKRVFEEYVALAIIAVFGAIHFMFGGAVNSVVITVIIFVLAYSVGLIPWVDHLFESRRLTFFVSSYAFFILMLLFLFAGIYHSNSSEFLYPAGNVPLSFVDSLYYSTVTFTTVGFGDVTPLGINKFISAMEALFGMVVNIAFIGYFFASKRIAD